MIEAFWRSLEHSWLYLHSLESIESLRRLVDFYVRQHNGRKRSFRVIPHAAFEGQTQHEMYFARGDPVAVKLAAARIKARDLADRRRTAPRNAACATRTPVHQRFSCNARVPECRETQRGGFEARRVFVATHFGVEFGERFSSRC